MITGLIGVIIIIIIIIEIIIITKNTQVRVYYK